MSDRLAYGMGWVVDTSSQPTIVWHNGATPDFYSYLALVPDEGLGLAVLLNASNISDAERLDAFSRELLDTLISGEEPEPVDLELSRFAKTAYAAAGTLLGIQVLGILGLTSTLLRGEDQQFLSGRIASSCGSEQVRPGANPQGRQVVLGK
ncbi:MAG: beta-lactamase family protein [bacterium]|nr:beta-lactamase family protein [bacterium]